MNSKNERISHLLDDSTSPADVLDREIRRLGLTQEEFAQRAGCSRQSISQLVNGHKSITRDMAQRLGDATDFSMDDWIALQLRFEEFQARRHQEVLSLASHAPNAAHLGNRWTAPSVLGQQQIAALIQSGELTVEPWLPQNLQPASLDLTIGQEAALDGRGKVPLGGGSNTLLLEPGHTVLVGTAERIELPTNVVARVGGCTDLMRRGVFISTGLHVDPGYRGIIFVCLHNFGADPVQLKKDETFLSIEFHRLSFPTSPYVGRYQDCSTITDDVADHYRRSVDMKIDGKNAFLQHCPLPGISLKQASVDLRYKDSKDGVVVQLPSFESFEGRGDDLDKAVRNWFEELVELYDYLNSSDGREEHGAAEQLAAIEEIIEDNRAASAGKVRALAATLSGRDIADIPAGYISIKNGDKYLGRLKVRGDAHGTEISTLAKNLGISDEQCQALIDGRADRIDYLRWRGEKIE